MSSAGNNTNCDASTTRSRAGTRTSGIQPGFLNRAARRRGPGGAQQAQPSSAAETPPRATRQAATPTRGSQTSRTGSSSSISTLPSTSAISPSHGSQSQQPAWTDRALSPRDKPRLMVMLPEEGFTQLHVPPEAGRSDTDFKAVCYALPFAASDGRAALASLSFESVPFPSRDVYDKACRYYQRVGIQAPPFTMADERPYVPLMPLYLPAGENDDPLLFDYASMIVWPLVDVKQLRSGHSAIPWYEGRQVHFLVGPPVNDAPPLGDTQGESINSALSSLFELRQRVQQLLGDVAASSTPRSLAQPAAASSSATAAAPTATSSTPPSEPGEVPRALVPREEHTAQASLMPADGNFFFDMYSGRRPAAHYQLPFLAADGRQTIVLMPADTFPRYREGTTQGPLDVFDAWGIAPPDTDVPNHPPIAYIPIRPTYVPANPSNNCRPALLVDQSSGYIWPLITTSNLADEDLSGGNTHNAHYVAGLPMWGPPFDPLEIDNGAFPEIRAEDSPYHGPGPETHGFSTSSNTQQQSRQQQSHHLSTHPRHRLTQAVIDSLQRATLLEDEDLSILFEIMSNVMPTSYFGLPVTAAEGRQAIVAMPAESLAWLPSEDEGQRQHGPVDPIYLPAELTHDNQPALWETRSGIVWPLFTVTDPNAPTLSARQRARNPHFVAGRPVYDVEEALQGVPAGHVFMTGVFESREDQARNEARRRDYPARVKRFVNELDTADAELRLRMTRLGIGQVGDNATDGAPGCAICLEEFGENCDKPEWHGGASVHDQRVVMTPCGGYHLFHRGCLRKTLETVDTWRQWSCPMCRSPLRDAAAKRVEQEEGTSRAGAGSTSHKTTQKSLREEIRRREKERGYLCDYPACYPTYDKEAVTAKIVEIQDDDGEDGKAADSRLVAELDRRLITLEPCGHSVHRECLLAEMSVKDKKALAAAAEESEEASVSESGNDEGVDGIKHGLAAAGLDGERLGSNASQAVHEVAAWVKCPVDRKKVFAMIPVIKSAVGQGARESDKENDDAVEGANGGSDDQVGADVAESSSSGALGVSKGQGQAMSEKKEKRKGKKGKKGKGKAKA